MESESSNSSNSGDHLQGHSPPRRSGGGPNLQGPGQLRLAGVSSPPRPPPRAIRPVPAMGVPGVSAFTPYTRPRPGPSTTTNAGGIPGLPSFTIYNRAPPRPDWYPHPHPGPGSSSGLGFGYGYGFGYLGPHPHVGPVGGSGRGPFEGGAHPRGISGKGPFEGGTHPHGGSGKGPFEGGALRIGGSPGKKRGREEGNASGSGKQQAAEMYPVPCPICGREFMSEKALFGHMRSHPNRGWKGVHPPPAFNADEEFADVPGLNRPEGMEAAEREGVGVAEGPAPAAEGGGDTEMQPQGGAEEHYTLPDLNMPPPPSPDQ